MRLPLVARYCVTAAADIPCARIDFNVVNPVNLARYPWLLLLEVADQLDRRWPRRVFERLDRFMPYRSLAKRMTSELTREAGRGLDGMNAEDIERQVTEMFVRRLNGAADNRPIVLIVDTLEEVILGSAGGPERLIRLLATLLRECPALRLVLAGRYDLRERAAEAMAELEPAESVRLTDFAPEQVIAYLADIRGITDPAMHAAVISRTHGQPFLVALLANFVEDQPDTTPEELLNYREPLTHFLIDRVIQRIADPNVRWLVRYGVVPRRLRFDDLTAVMGKLMARSRSGPGKWDDPRDDRHHLRGRDDVFPFGDPPKDEAALADVWQQLLTYAARPSWVSPADDGQSVVFHPNVREPMRDLISQRQVFRELHDAFRRQFVRLAEENPASRTAYLREAVYHRVQLDDPGATGFWRAEVIRCRNSCDLDGMDELAGELLRDDYTDENGLPRRRSNGEPVLPYRALADAHVFQAYVAAERARAVQAGASDPLWSAAARSLSHAALVRGRAAEPLAASALEAALQAAWLVAESKPAEAVALAQDALAGASNDNRVDLLRVIGDAHAALGDAPDGSSYRAALELADELGRADQQDAIARSLASQSEAQGRLDKAVEWISRLAKSTTGTMAGAKRAWQVGRARLLIDCYQPAAALRSLEDARASDLAAVVEVALLRAEAYRLLGRASHALGELQAATSAAGLKPTSDSYPHLAQIHQLRGVVLGEMLAGDKAEDSFQLAIGLWGEIGFSDGHPECAHLYHRFLIRDVGDLAAAAQVVRPVPEAAGELALRWNEDTDELFAAMKLPDRPQLTESQLAGLSPRQAARAIAARLAHSWPQYRHLLPALTDALGRIRPPSARLLVLDELRRCEKAVPADVEQLREAFEMTAPLSYLAEDAALQQGLLAELDRLRGSHALAGHEFDDSITGLPPLPAARLARWRWLQARNRLQTPGWPRVEYYLQQATSLADASTDYPLLRAASLLALASVDPFAANDRLLLEQAITCLAQVDRPTRWAADIFTAAGRYEGDESLLATGANLDRQLGRPDRAAATASVPAADWSGQILADRPSEQAADLPRPGWVTPDIALQRRLVADWPNLAREMGDALFGELAWQEAMPSLTALRLQSDDVAVQALPWELATPPWHATGRRWPVTVYRSLPEAAARLDTRWLQRALCSLGQELPVDGVFGPNTWRERGMSVSSAANSARSVHVSLGRAAVCRCRTASWRAGPDWAQFLRSQAEAILALDLFTVDLLDGTKAYVLAAIEHATRRIRILGATAHPGGQWIVQQARNLCMDLDQAGANVKFVLHDRDATFHEGFDAVFTAASLRIVPSGVRMPRMNSIMERWIGGCRRELLDRTLIWNLPHLRRILAACERHHNDRRPDMALSSAAPLKPPPAEVTDLEAFRVRRRDRVGGVIHEYQHAA